MQRHVDSECANICRQSMIVICNVYIDTTMVYINAGCDQCGNMLLPVQREPRPLDPNSLQSLALYSAWHKPWTHQTPKPSTKVLNSVLVAKRYHGTGHGRGFSGCPAESTTEGLPGRACKECSSLEGSGRRLLGLGSLWLLLGL